MYSTKKPCKRLIKTCSLLFLDNHPWNVKLCISLLECQTIWHSSKHTCTKSTYLERKVNFSFFVGCNRFNLLAFDIFGIQIIHHTQSLVASSEAWYIIGTVQSWQFNLENNLGFIKWTVILVKQGTLEGKSINFIILLNTLGKICICCCRCICHIGRIMDFLGSYHLGNWYVISFPLRGYNYGRSQVLFSCDGVTSLQICVNTWSVCIKFKTRTNMNLVCCKWIFIHIVSNFNYYFMSKVQKSRVVTC